MRAEDAESLLADLLAALPYLSRPAGLDAGEVSAALNIPYESLKQLLNVLQFCGLPPYGGGDTFDCVVEGQRLSLTTPLAPFRRPVRLSAKERTVLAIGLRLIGELATGHQRALQALSEKLAACLSPTATGAATEQAVGRIQPTEAQPDVEQHLRALAAAIEDRVRVRLAYYSLNRDALTDRVVEPIRLECVKGRWYLLAHCLQRRRALHFRLDRMREVERLAERVTRRMVIRESSAMAEPPAAEHVRLRVAAEIARDWQESQRRFVVSVGRARGGEAEVVVATSSAPWLSRLVLRHAGKVRVLAPEHMRRAVAEAARAALALYEVEQHTQGEGPNE